ncbi:MAG: ATP-dependent DNA helicase [Parvibaculaceae bacterium]|nr:ATP-dependent DNA helicase [Parvibaculaceae bacterium]
MAKRPDRLYCAIMNLPTLPDSPDHAGLALPDCPALVAAPSGAVLVTMDGEVEMLAPDEAVARLAKEPFLAVHADFLMRRLGRGRQTPPPSSGVLDLLELYAFVCPAQPCLPTPAGLARALGLPAPADAEAQALTLHEAAFRLMTMLADPAYPDRPSARRTAMQMAQAGWPWGEGVLAALGSAMEARPLPQQAKGDAKLARTRGFDIWNELPEWEDRAPPAPGGHMPVSPDEARARLAALVGPDAEERPGQSDYAAIATYAFEPRERAGEPRLMIAEAGTGIGKTLGYIASASLWAERNKATVWISTYTKNLQRQLDQELVRLFPDPAERMEKAVVRKGRENYLCLLNYAEFAERAALGGAGVTAGLVARWAKASRDGDMVGGDFPAWLGPRIAAPTGRGTFGLTDRRGECVYSACPHYRKCFIEKAVRKARRAEIVVANHALVMTQAALDLAMTRLNAAKGKLASTEIAAHADNEEAPSGREARLRFVFDEGHHLFDAADSAFSAHLSAQECFELRRWLRGAESGRGRGRGLEERISDLAGDHEEARSALAEALAAALALPGPAWSARLNEGAPHGAAERFLALVRQQVHARAASESETSYSLEAETEPMVEGLAEAAAALDAALARLMAPLARLADMLRQRLDDKAEELDTATRIRIDAAARGLDRRGRILIPAWRHMLAGLATRTPDEFVDWFSIDRQWGHEVDIGMSRHWKDPTLPFAEAVLEPAHGVLITSATLRDRLPEDAAGDDGWASAEVRTGASHLVTPPRRAAMASPFDYAKMSRVLIVRDVDPRDANAVAAAYRSLFLASNGGALGLFTSIRRLEAVHGRLMGPLEAQGLSLYAQHVDALDTGTLVDIFRAERNACLLGTDAVRDGVDVPGASLRLIVFDRTPWPRPDILHRARRQLFGPRHYDDMLTRLRLKQAFGRLIRSAQDRGIFVMLDARLPSRLLTAFPPDIPVARVGLAEAVAATRDFFREEPAFSGENLSRLAAPGPNT